MASMTRCLPFVLTICAAPQALAQPTANQAPPATPPETTQATPAAPQSFDPKVRRIGVQRLEESPAAPSTEVAQPDPPLTVLPGDQARSLTQPSEGGQALAEDDGCTKEPIDCEPKPKFKVGAELFLLPIQDTGIGANKDARSRRIHQRARLSAQGRWRSLGIAVGVQDVRRWGEGAAPGATSDYVNTALYQGYMELTGENKDLGYRSFIRVGRQAIVWGEQRLLGYGLWSIHGRAHDAVRALVEYKGFDFDLFWSIRRPSSQPADNPRNSGAHLGGVRLASRHLSFLSAELQGLLHHNDGDNPQNTDTLGNVGVRLFGDPIPALHYSFEGNYQFGKRNTVDHRAWAVAGWAQWTQALAGDLNFRFKLGATAASGNKGDGKSREFFNFYPANHRNYGMVDLLGWRNMVDYEAQVGLQFAKTFDIGAAYHYLGLQSANGAWKSAPGVVLAPGGNPSNQDKSLGSEIDLFANYRPLKALKLQLGYGLFLPTDAAFARLAAVPGQRRVQQRVFLLVNAKL